MRRGADVGEAGHRALEGVRVQVRHARQRRPVQPLRAVGRGSRFQRDDVAAVDADENIARPARGQ